ncbi:MAG: DUF1565 domain-containing protein, partial [Deltaproteobacteria bacterium]|nr:DUF1565 domain-containing protein [Deltaproteobacteria bacterium]
MEWGRASRLGAGLVLALCSCSSESETAEQAPAACLPPDRLLDDGRCLAPDVQDDGCRAGELGLADGTCQPAGVPPELCAEGFEAVDGGCQPVLPAEPCPKGTVALPGETACHPLGDCGAAPWGDLPVDGATQYVDAGYTGGSSDGSAQAPWTTIGEAIAAAAPGALIAVAAGSYAENVMIASKSVRLWGRCAELVEVVGTSGASAA